MLVNSGVARFQDYAHETVSQILESLRTFQRAWVFPADLHSYPLSKQRGSAWTSFCRRANHCGVQFVKELAKLSPVKVI